MQQFVQVLQPNRQHTTSVPPLKLENTPTWGVPDQQFGLVLQQGLFLPEVLEREFAHVQLMLGSVGLGVGGVVPGVHFVTA